MPFLLQPNGSGQRYFFAVYCRSEGISFGGTLGKISREPLLDSIHAVETARDHHFGALDFSVICYYDLLMLQVELRLTSCIWVEWRTLLLLLNVSCADDILNHTNLG